MPTQAEQIRDLRAELAVVRARLSMLERLYSHWHDGQLLRMPPIPHEDMSGGTFRGKACRDYADEQRKLYGDK